MRKSLVAAAAAASLLTLGATPAVAADNTSGTTDTVTVTVTPDRMIASTGATVTGDVLRGATDSELTGGPKLTWYSDYNADLIKVVHATRDADGVTIKAKLGTESAAAVSTTPARLKTLGDGTDTRVTEATGVDVSYTATVATTAALGASTAFSLTYSIGGGSV